MILLKKKVENSKKKLVFCTRFNIKLKIKQGSLKSSTDNTEE